MDAETRSGRSPYDTDDDIKELGVDSKLSFGVWIDGGEKELIEVNGDSEVELDDSVSMAD